MKCLSGGTELKNQPKDNLVTLEKQLITLYTFYLDCQEMSDNDEYPDPPPFPEKEYQEVIKKNFPDIGYYSMVLDNAILTADNNWGIGDAIDDVSDILRDLWDINWYFKNTSVGNAVFYFRLLFYSHTKGHVIGLINSLSK